MTNAELDIMMKLPYIRRWQIVRTYHTQTVAAHSYRVWLLATHLYDVLFPVPHNSFSRELLQRWAMVHDVDEVLTGDLPSTVKAVLEEVSPGIVNKFTDRVLVDLPMVAATRNGIQGTLENLLVKIADNVEAIKYLHEDGMGDCTSIIQSRVNVIATLYERIKKEYTGVEHIAIQGWVVDRLEGFTW